jgi:hypothetical protein
VDIGKEETDAFLAAVESKVAPLLVAHYKAQVAPKVAQPVRAKGDEFVRVTKDATNAAMTQTADARKAIGDALRKQAEAIDAAAAATDQSVLLAAKKPAAPADDVKKSADAAATALATASAAADFAQTAISKFADQARPLDGAADLSERVAPVREFFAHVAEAERLYAALVEAGRIPDFIELAEEHFARGIERRLTEIPRAQGVASTARAPLAHAFAGAMLSMLQWWLDRGMPNSPEQMDALFHQMVWSGVSYGAAGAKQS